MRKPKWVSRWLCEEAQAEAIALFAAGPWQDGPPPENAGVILGAWKVSYRQSGWRIEETWYVEGGRPWNRNEPSYWVNNNGFKVRAPDKWASINLPEE